MQVFRRIHRGVVDQSFKEWSRWTNKVFDYKVAHLGCRLTKEIDKNARCIFSLTFSPEKLVESGGDLVEALRILDAETLKERRR